MLADHGILFSLAVFVWNSLNIILDFMLMVGASCHIRFSCCPSLTLMSCLRCLFLPWLVVSLFQLLVVGCLTVLGAAYASLGLILQACHHLIPNLS